MIRILIIALLCIWLGLTLDAHATEPCVGEEHLMVLLLIAALAGAVFGILYGLIVREGSPDSIDRDYPEGPY